jgi:hypothetical protein
MRPTAQAEKSGGGKLMFEDEMRALHHGGDTNTEVSFLLFFFAILLRN